MPAHGGYPWPRLWAQLLELELRELLLSYYISDICECSGLLIRKIGIIMQGDSNSVSMGTYIMSRIESTLQSMIK